MLLEFHEGSGYKEFRTQLISLLNQIQKILDSGNTFSYSLIIKLTPINLVDPDQGKEWKYERK